jgi:Filamin/ABP280 repeat
MYFEYKINEIEWIIIIIICGVLYVNGCSSGFQIEGPSQTKIECNDNGDGSANVSYVPFAPGEYAVHILCDDEDIQGSPWMASVVAATGDFDPTKVSVGLCAVFF